MFRKKGSLFVGLVLSLLTVMVSGVAHAALITGSINAGPSGGLIATSPWNSTTAPAKLSWEVDYVGTNWVYKYTFDLPRKDLSHLIIGTSENFTASNVKTGTSAGWELGTWSSAQGNSNAGITGPLYGLKFPGPKTNGLHTMFTIVTDRGPQWSTFYAKDGKDGGNDVYANSASFGQSSPASVYGPAPFGFIIGPDTVGGPPNEEVPAPAGTAAFLAIGLSALVLTRKRKHALAA